MKPFNGKKFSELDVKRDYLIDIKFSKFEFITEYMIEYKLKKSETKKREELL